MSSQTEIVYAIAKRNIRMINQFLINAADIKDDPMVLFVAVWHGSLEIVEDLLKSGADPNVIDESILFRGQSPLHIALDRDRDEIAKLLIKYGADVNVKDREGETPIMYAIDIDNTEMIDILLTNAADIQEDPKVLYAAVGRGNLKIVEELLKNGTDANMIYKLHPNEMLMHSADPMQRIACPMEMIRSGIPLNSKYQPAYYINVTPLHIAAHWNRVEMAKLLIKYGADVNVKDQTGEIPIIYAIRNTYTEMVDLLLNNGADIQEDPNILCIAVDNGNLTIVENLLTNGADPNMIFNLNTGATLIHTAVRSNRVEVAKLLIKYGADVNVKCREEGTPIIYAIKKKNKEMIELFLSNGVNIKENPKVLRIALRNKKLKIAENLLKNCANPNVKDRREKIPIIYVIQRKNTEMIEHRLTNGVDIKEEPKVLCIAVENGNLKIADDLKKNCANPNVKDRERKTPIIYPIQRKNTEMIEHRLTNGVDIKEDPKVLCIAVENGNLKIAEDLLKNVADPNMICDLDTGATLIHTAVRCNQVEIAKLLIKYGADVNVKDRKGETPILYAIRYMYTEIIELLLINGADIKEDPMVLCAAAGHGSLKLVEDLLKNGADPNVIGKSTLFRRERPLHVAIRWNRVEIAKLLIKYGADVNAKNRKGETPILRAIVDESPEMVELLLTSGVDIKEDINLLFRAIVIGNPKIAEDLLKNGADPNVINKSMFYGQKPLHIAMNRHRDVIAKLLVKYGADVNIKFRRGETLIHCAIRFMLTEFVELLLTNGADIKEDPELLRTAIRNGNLRIIEDLLKHGADPNIIYDVNTSGAPMHFAVDEDRVDIVKLLLKYGADVNVKNRTGETPIVCAIRKKNTEMIDLLLNNGADIQEDPNILYIAVDNGNLTIVENLLTNGADPNMICDLDTGATLIHTAASGNQVEIAKLLIKYGADVNVKDRKGETPILYAIRYTYTEIIELLLINGADIKEDPELLRTAIRNGNLRIIEDLLKHGADPNIIYDVNTSGAPMHFAVDEDRVDIVKLLLKYGADVNVKDRTGETPIVCAIRKKNTEMIDLLLNNGADIQEDPNILCIAVDNGNLTIVENLLTNGADPNMICDLDTGATLIHTAASGNQVEIAKLLIKYGADVNVKDRKGETAITYATRYNYAKMIELLLTNGADIKEDVNTDLVSMMSLDTKILLKQHIAKMKAAGLYVSERNLLLISNDNEINNFLNKCEAEIQIMKSEKIDNSCASFYDILTKNKSLLAKNEGIVQALKSDGYKTKFPIYASMIDSRFRRGLEREELLEQCRKKFLHSLFASLSELPFLCTEKIFSYLTDRDLRILLVA